MCESPPHVAVEADAHPMGPQDEGFSSALAVSGMMTPTDKSGKLWCKPEVVQMREDDASEEQSQNEDDRRSVFDRAKGVIGSARRQVSRSVDVVTGEDIRRFDEFTDATTRAVVGVHQDLSELREEFGRTHRAVDDIHERQEHLTERLDQLEQLVGRRTSPLPWFIVAGVSAVAILLSILAVLLSVL